MKIVITGGCGFLGSNLAAAALSRGDDLTVFDNLSRTGSVSNLTWLSSIGKFSFIHGDIRNATEVTCLIRDACPDVVFHLAGQVAMTSSITNPRNDFEINVLGSINLLESVRQFSPNTIVIYSSTNKVYGDLEQFHYQETETRYICLDRPNGFDETTYLDFHSPYSCSKGSADQYMLDYARIFGLNTMVFRHSSLYGSRQFATYDQGWIGWFCQQAVDARAGLLREPFTISGNGKQVRDVLHADDMVSLYFLAVERIAEARGNAFNIGGGMSNSLSLLELFEILQESTNTKLIYTKLPPRGSDQRVFVADIAKAERILGWQPYVGKVAGVRRMLEWVEHAA